MPALRCWNNWSPNKVVPEQFKYAMALADLAVLDAEAGDWFSACKRKAQCEAEIIVAVMYFLIWTNVWKNE